MTTKGCVDCGREVLWLGEELVAHSEPACDGFDALLTRYGGKPTTVRQSSRDFSCPSCGLKLGLGDQGGEIIALHEMPLCEHFVAAETLKQILGPHNYELLGQPLEN